MFSVVNILCLIFYINCVTLFLFSIYCLCAGITLSNSKMATPHYNKAANLGHLQRRQGFLHSLVNFGYSEKYIFRKSPGGKKTHTHTHTHSLMRTGHAIALMEWQAVGCYFKLVGREGWQYGSGRLGILITAKGQLKEQRRRESWTAESCENTTENSLVSPTYEVKLPGRLLQRCYHWLEGRVEVYLPFSVVDCPGQGPLPLSTIFFINQGRRESWCLVHIPQRAPL